MTAFHVSRMVQESLFHGGFRTIASRVLNTGIAVFLAVAIVPGLEAQTFSAGLAAVLVLTILNLLLRPLLFILTLPLILLSLGIFVVVLNALLLELTAYLVKGFTVSGFWPAVGGALVISLVTNLLNFWTADRQSIESVAASRRPPTIINPD
jgi:putative membrane protein